MPGETIRFTYKLTPKIESIERSVELLLAEMTGGIQYVSTRTGVKMDRCVDSVPFVDDSVNGEVLSCEQIDEESYSIRFSLPITNMDVALGGITNLWPMIAGEVFNFHFIKRASLVELTLPESFTQYYKGPGFGIDGIRDLLGIHDKPLFGSILKPNLGLNPDRAAHTVIILAKAGFNFVKDDEISVNPLLSPLQQRVRAISGSLDEIQQKEGHKVIFAANVTSDFSVLGRAAETAIEAGAGGLMLDPFCTGLSAIDYLRRRFEVPIYVHRVGYGLFCSGPSYSISYEVFTNLFRLLGADFSHVGGIWGKPESAKETTSKYLNILRHKSSKRTTWPVVTGISTENMSDYYQFYGDDTMFMDHIDIYGDEESSRKKLESLKSKIARGR